VSIFLTGVISLSFQIKKLEQEMHPETKEESGVEDRHLLQPLTMQGIYEAISGEAT
jgi:hypothetical protein